MSSSESTATAVAHANFALVKYWGKRDAERNMPDVGSISITLDALSTTTRVRLDASLAEDRFRLGDAEHGPEQARVRAFVERFRALSGEHRRADIESRNDFPTGAGLASSASGFAALARALVAAAGLDWSARRVSELARMGSGSAARSIFGGFVEMARGDEDDGSDAVAFGLAAPESWPLEVVVAIGDASPKAVGSTLGMQRTAMTSPFYRAWVEQQPRALAQARRAIEKRDFEALADVSEASAMTMHGLALSARPPLMYFDATTVECLHRLRALRSSGTPVFFTVDAGPQVKAIFLPGHRDAVRDALSGVSGVTRLVDSGLGPGAHCVDEPDAAPA